MRPLFNVHTHRPLPQGEESIRCCGLHPWHVTEDFGRELTLLFDPFHCHANNAPLLIQAIGECGLDRLCQTPYDLQLRAFRAQIAESEKHRLPMIVHCVKAIDDIIALHADATQAWIIHGFRGKPQQLSQLISHGFYVSFGVRHNSDSLAACPPDRFFLETDDVETPIRPLYEQAATTRRTDIDTLITQQWANAKTVFADLQG